MDFLGHGKLDRLDRFSIDLWYDESITNNIKEDRSVSKQNPEVKMFYYAMHGDDWEAVVDNDTQAICEHAEKIKNFFHKPLYALRVDIFQSGCHPAMLSNKNGFVRLANDFFDEK